MKKTLTVEFNIYSTICKCLFTPIILMFITTKICSGNIIEGYRNLQLSRCKIDKKTSIDTNKKNKKEFNYTSKYKANILFKNTKDKKTNIRNDNFNQPSSNASSNSNKNSLNNLQTFKNHQIISKKNDNIPQNVGNIEKKQKTQNNCLCINSKTTNNTTKKNPKYADKKKIAVLKNAYAYNENNNTQAQSHINNEFRIISDNLMKNSMGQLTKKSIHRLALKNISNINHFENQLYKNNTKINSKLAVSAALIGLFQPHDIGKVNFTVGIGGYNSSHAIAIGSGYRINRNAAVKASFAYFDKKNVMYNISLHLGW